MRAFPRRNRGAGGFTLLEILIALFIFAIVLSTLFTSYTGTFKIMEGTESQAGMYSKARITLARIQEDLESVCFTPAKSQSSFDAPPPPTRFVGEESEIGGRKADTLRFASLAHLIFNEDDLDAGSAEIRFEVREEGEGDAFCLYRVDTPLFNEPPEAGTGGLLLCDGLYSVTFTYVDKEGESYESWDSTSDSFLNKLPAMVKVSLEFMNEQDEQPPLKFVTAVAIPMGGEDSAQKN